jgi:hypothetical protein
MLYLSRLFFSFIISYPPLQTSSSIDEESSDEDDVESFVHPITLFSFHELCNKVGDKYEYSEVKAAKCLVDNPDLSDLQVVAGKKYLALVAKGKADWMKYNHLFTDNGRLRSLANMKRTIEVNGETWRFALHHLCQSSLAGSDRVVFNVIPLRDDVGDHADIHVQASLLFSDQEVQNSAQLMLNLSGQDLSYFLNEASDEIRRANHTEANNARYEVQSERMQGNQYGAGSHDYSSGRQSRGPGNSGNNFAFGHRHGLVHEDAAILADFDKYDCASHSWWKKWLEMKNGDLIEFNDRHIVKSLGNEMRAMRCIVGRGRNNAKLNAKRAAVKATKEVAKKAEKDAEKDAAKKRWSSFFKK